MKNLDALLEAATVDLQESSKWHDESGEAVSVLGRWTENYGEHLLDALTSLLEENRRLQSERDQFENLLMDAKEDTEQEVLKRATGLHEKYVRSFYPSEISEEEK